MRSEPADGAARARSRWAFLAKPWWLVVITVALAFTAACWTILAPWQFSRNAETSARNAAISAAATAPPVPATDYLTTAGQPDPSQVWKVVTAAGQFDPGHQVYVRLRQDANSNPSAEVVLPFRLDDGTVLWVDRGYVPDDTIRAGTPAPAPPAGRVTISGRVQLDQPDPLHRAPQQQNGMRLVIGIDTTALSADAGITGYRRGFVQLIADSPGVLEEIGVPQLDSGPYLSYALQWCAFGGIALLAIGYFVYKEATDPRDDGETGATPEPAAEPVPARRGREKFDRRQLYDQ